MKTIIRKNTETPFGEFEVDFYFDYGNFGIGEYDYQGVLYNDVRKELQYSHFKIAEVIEGFENYNKRVKDDGFYLPNNARIADFSKLPNQRAKLTVCGIPNHGLKADEFLLMTIRSHDQFNTTIYGMDDRYRGIYNERRILMMNPSDMAEKGFKKKDLVDIVSEYEGIRRVAAKFLVIPYSIPKQNLACYFPEANVLVPINHFAKDSQTPISKSIKVKVHRIK